MGSESERTMVARWAASVALNVKNLLSDDQSLTTIFAEEHERQRVLEKLNSDVLALVDQLSNFYVARPFESFELFGLSTGKELVHVTEKHLASKSRSDALRNAGRLPLPVFEDDGGWTVF
jgi:hypothetical protein